MIGNASKIPSPQPYTKINEARGEGVRFAGLTGPGAGAVPSPAAPPPYPWRPPRFKCGPCAPPCAADSESARATQGPLLEGLEGPEVIRAHGHSATRCATTWDKSFQLCQRGLPVPTSREEARPLAPAPCLAALSRPQLPGNPPLCSSSETPPFSAQVPKGK